MYTLIMVTTTEHRRRRRSGTSCTRRSAWRRARVPGREAFSFVSLARARTPGARAVPPSSAGNGDGRGHASRRARSPRASPSVRRRSRRARVCDSGPRRCRQTARAGLENRQRNGFLRVFAPKTSAFEATNDARGAARAPWARTSWRARQGRSSGATGAWRGRRGRRRNRLDDVSRAGGEPRAPASSLRVEDRVVLGARRRPRRERDAVGGEPRGTERRGGGRTPTASLTRTRRRGARRPLRTAARSSSTEGMMPTPKVWIFIPIPRRSR